MRGNTSPKSPATLLILALLPALVVPISIGQEKVAAAEAFGWSPQSSGVQVILTGVSALDSSNVWAVGENGTILHFDGTSWSRQASGTTRHLQGVYALDPGNVWAVGANGTILRYNGATWSNQASGTTENLWGVSGVSASCVFAVGERQTRLRYNGTSWSGSPQNNAILFGVFALNEGSAWAVGGADEIDVNVHQFHDWYWMGSFSNTTKELRGVCALNAANAWAVGRDGTIIHCKDSNANTWSGQSSGTANHLNGVSAIDTRNVWAVGANGTILHYNGSAWSGQPSGTTRHLTGVSASASGEVWAVGENGTILRSAKSLSTWYLAEGTTAWGFRTSVVIYNPNEERVTTRVTYMSDKGPFDMGDVSVPGRSIVVLNPADSLGEADFSTKVVCNEGKTIAVDRSMWLSGDYTFRAGHASIGVTSPSRTWYMPEGSSAWGYECWLLIQNPNNRAATCTVTYMIEGRGPETRIKNVPANSRRTFSMKEDIGEADASIKVDSDIPVIPERAMYWRDRWGGHDSIGTTEPSRRYYLAEGTAGWGFTTYVLVQNPNASETTVTVTYMTDSGPRKMEPFRMDANSRKTIRMNDEPGMAGTDASTMIEGTLPIIAERAMYWDGGEGPVGHDSIGIPGPHSTFYMPSGQYDEYSETWTLVQNPGAEPVEIEVFYHMGNDSKSLRDTVGAGSRKTYSLADVAIPGSRMVCGITVKCLTPGGGIIAERAYYRLYPLGSNRRTNGCETIGAYWD